MTEQRSLFDAAVPLAPTRTIYRNDDPPTSAAAARRHVSRNSHAAAMLAAYAAHGPLTDVEAAEIAGLERVEATRRASDLRNRDLIEPLRDVGGELVTRPLPTGRAGMVCSITAAGRAIAGGSS